MFFVELNATPHLSEAKFTDWGDMLQLGRELENQFDAYAGCYPSISQACQW